MVIEEKKKRRSYRKDPEKLTLPFLQNEKERTEQIKEEFDKLKAGPITYHTTRKKKISKNTAYKRGRVFEYRVKKHFEKQGYYVVRKYASKGAEDLVAMKRIDLPGSKFRCSETLFIQCKNLKVEKKLKRVDAERLIALAKKCGGTPLLATNKNHKLNIMEVS